MSKKKHPVLGHSLTITIIVDSQGFCNNEVSLETPVDSPSITTEKKEKNQEYILTRRNGNTVTLKSKRLLEAFAWLQGKEFTTISKNDLAEALSLDGDQTQKVLHTLHKEKRLIHYEHTPDGKLKIIRVDDIRRLKPKYSGVPDES